jgi:hypothetical protein
LQNETRISNHLTLKSVGLGAEKRQDEFISQSPGCRQGSILVPAAVRQLLPGSATVFDLETFWNEDTGSREGGEAS